jgi:hypothetical protein
LVKVTKFAETIAHGVVFRVVMNVNVPEIDPAGIVTDAGTLKPAFVDDKTMVEGVGAAAVRVTEQFPFRPAAMVVGTQESVEREYDDGESATTNDTAVGPERARIVAFAPLAIAPLLTVKSAVLAPEGTVTEAASVRTAG